jgi:hypothetical protein
MNEPLETKGVLKMDQTTGPYTPVAPGDLLTASLFNQMQVSIRDDIEAQIQNALGTVDEVRHAMDSDKLGGMSVDEFTAMIIKKTIAAVSGSNGSYRRYFRRLVVGEERRIEHSLGSFPQADIYQLDYFPAFCAGGDEDDEERIRPVNFYLYHGMERRIRLPHKESAKALMLEIEEANEPPARLKFGELLDLYQVSYTPATSLEELEADFWEALFRAQGNDEFDPAQYCHSAWFEKCCNDSRSVQELQDKGDWDRIYLKVRPRKTINLRTSELVVDRVDVEAGEGTAKKRVKGTTFVEEKLVAQLPTHSAPTQLQVVQYDFNNLGVKLLDRPLHTPQATGGWGFEGRKICGPVPGEFLEEMNVMILLKV